MAASLLGPWSPRVPSWPQLLLALAVDWQGISTAVVTCLLTALTTIGASRQKQILRIGGAVAGGAVAMGAQIWRCVTASFNGSRGCGWCSWLASP